MNEPFGSTAWAAGVGSATSTSAATISRRTFTGTQTTGASWSSAHTRAEVIGNVPGRIPAAAAMPLAIAAGTPHTGGSPTPLAPNGPSGAGTSTSSVSIGGT